MFRYFRLDYINLIIELLCYRVLMAIFKPIPCGKKSLPRGHDRRHQNVQKVLQTLIINPWGWRIRLRAKISELTDSGGLHDVPDDELADGLVLGASLGAVGAPHELDMATTVLVPAVVTALGSHL